MLALIQRVTQARVEVRGSSIGEIGRGLVVLVCAEPADTDALADKLVARLLKLRVCSDAAGKMNRGHLSYRGVAAAHRVAETLSL